MYEGKPHPLLAQIPLTVSPFISLPTATTLPYTYKPLPSTLPPSSTADTNGVESEKYIVSPSGHSAHPDEIIASCHALQVHLQRMQEDAEKTLRDWEANVKEQELAEKRRVAPGWLDRDEKILQPERTTNNPRMSGSIQDRNTPVSLMDSQDSNQHDMNMQNTITDAAGDELDRAFGGMALGRK
ncbi:hypothetical protein MMC07_003477 [Pseudocyphellaria aurata]|nr:hypothetical protein [Pseudocyphellaria aurata]